MAPLDQSFIKAYTSESTVDTMQPIAPQSESPSGPVPAPHARFRPVQPQTLTRGPAEGSSVARHSAAGSREIGRTKNGPATIDRSDIYAAWTTSVSSDSLSADSVSGDRSAVALPTVAPPEVSPQSERQIAIDDDVELPTDDEFFQHDGEQPVSIPMPLPSQNAQIVLRPELEVDRFVWADPIEKLEQLDRIRDLIDVLAKTSSTGDNVLVLAGQQSGSGVSTLVLAAARELANRGLRVVVVDANFKKPALAKMLGIAPPAGWEDVLGHHCPLAEVLVESLEDGVILLPLTGQAERELIAQSQTAISETLCALRLEFDIVLIDGGASDDGDDHHMTNDLLTSDAIDILSLAGAEIDAVVCVRDGRSEPIARAVTRPRRKTSSVRQLGVVENFTL